MHAFFNVTIWPGDRVLLLAKLQKGMHTCSCGLFGLVTVLLLASLQVCVYTVVNLTC